MTSSSASRRGDPRPPSRPARPSRIRVTGTVAAVAAVLGLVAAGQPRPEVLGVGDRLFPTLGNPGYDVLAYDISLHYSGDNTRPLQAKTTLRARATDARDGLSRFHLDFTGGEVRSVRVDGRPAQTTTAGEDLVVTPAEPVQGGATFRVTVRHTSLVRHEARGGWIRTADGLAMANQPDAAHTVFPGNDHPSDKARFTFRLTAPEEITAVAGGVLTGKDPAGPGTTWTYRGRHPMATELAQVAFGRSEVLRREGPHGLPLRHVIPAGHRATLEPWLARTDEQIAWMEKQVGRYPFATYGLLVADATTGFELETQTLSLFELRLLTSSERPAGYKESVMLHELAHQWFGDSVTPSRWSDLWLSEGHATWYEWRYAEHRGGRSVEDRALQAYRLSDGWREKNGPPAAPAPARPDERNGIFRKSMYGGSALVLYALREKIGPADFRALQRAWVQRYRDSTASTADFVDLASEISGRDLQTFLHAWLYGERTPPMPGHPGWVAR
jgi:aminopeptidase N